MSANIVSVDEESLRNDIKNLVRKTVEETLNALLDEEASELVGAERYERTAGREAYRSGHYTRRLVFVSSSGFQLRQRFFSHVARKGFRFGKGVPLSLFGFAS